MRRMESDQREFTGFYTIDNPVGHPLRKIVRTDMTPPDQHISLVQQLFCDSLVRFIQIRRTNAQIAVLAQVRGDLVSKKISVNFLLGRLLFIPNDDSNRSSSPGEKRKQTKQKHKN